MLLKPSTKFIHELVDESLEINDDGELEPSGIEDLFNAYLGMHEAADYPAIREQLTHLIHARLLDILHGGDDDEFVNSFDAFRLRSIKKSLANQTNDIFSHGSRTKVINQLKAWLKGGADPITVAYMSDEKYQDRYEFVLEAFSDEFRKLRLRSELALHIREVLTSGNSLYGFNPSDWKQSQNLLDELFNRLTYKEIDIDILKKMNFSNEQRRDLHLPIWRKIQEVYGYKDTNKTAWGGGAAAPKYYVAEIEKFLRYEDPYIFSGRDLENREDLEPIDDAKDDASINERLQSALLVCKRGFGKECRAFLKNYLADADMPITDNSLRTLWSDALTHEKGLVLSKLSQSGFRPSEIKFIKGDWVSICSKLGLDNKGKIEDLIFRVRKAVYPELVHVSNSNSKQAVDDDSE